jgi:transposase
MPWFTMMGYSGSYSTLRTYIKGHRSKPKAPVIRFETPPGAQAQMDWSTYTIDFTQEGRRRVQLFSYILG